MVFCFYIDASTIAEDMRQRIVQERRNVSMLSNVKQSLRIRLQGCLDIDSRHSNTSLEHFLIIVV